MLSVTELCANSRIINEKPLGKTKMRITYIFNYLDITMKLLKHYWSNISLLRLLNQIT